MSPHASYLSQQAAKAALRRQALECRAKVTPDIQSQFAGHLAKEGLRLARARLGVKCVSLYHPIRQEADCLPLLHALHEAGFNTALPLVEADKLPLRFLQWTPGKALIRSKMGLNEPDPAQNEVKPDVFFIPLAAFDRKGHRLGYGRGYFDASLAQARAERKVLAVGLAYKCQEIPAVPISDHDQRLDFVITESETLDFG